MNKNCNASTTLTWLVLLCTACYSEHPLAATTGNAGELGGRHDAGHAGASGGADNAAGSGSTAGHGGSSGGTAGDMSLLDAAVPERDAASDAGGPGGFVLSTDPGLRVAFLGDQSLNANADAVLELVEREHADLLIHVGDFAYVADVEAWNAQIDGILGPDFPYFAAIGNHDVGEWAAPGGYQSVLQARLDRIPGATCSGDLGVNSMCRYRGLSFVLSGVGTYGEDHENYLEEALDGIAIWRLCIWHKNQHDMQVGTKIDEVGWRAYQICQAHGAPIITAHEHSYARSYTLTALGNRAAQHGYTGAPDTLDFSPGSSAVAVVGLGGHSTRVWNGEDNPWWAAIYAKNLQQRSAIKVGTAAQIEFGALFVDFHVEQDPYKAHAYFKTVTNKVIDDFTMYVTPPVP